ncbi:MAG: hypothetical protein ACKVQK_05120 [Burkholderiales bacterium]
MSPISAGGVARLVGGVGVGSDNGVGGGIEGCVLAGAGAFCASTGSEEGGVVRVLALAGAGRLGTAPRAEALDGGGKTLAGTEGWGVGANLT